MPRTPRFHEPGSYRHVTARGNDPSGLFLDDGDRWTFLRLLGEVTRTSRWSCLGWCLLTTHYHLLVQERAQPLSIAMHRLHSAYVRAFNRRHSRRGHVFAGRYHVTSIEDDAHLLSALRYVARNPVDAGLCGQPEDWSWSSYGQLTGSVRPTSFLSRAQVLSLFDARPERAVELLRGFVEEVPGT